MWNEHYFFLGVYSFPIPCLDYYLMLECFSSQLIPFSFKAQAKFSLDHKAHLNASSI